LNLTVYINIYIYIYTYITLCITIHIYIDIPGVSNNNNNIKNMSTIITDKNVANELLLLNYITNNTNC